MTKATTPKRPRPGYRCVSVRLPVAAADALDAIMRKRSGLGNPLDPPVTIIRWMREHIQADAATLGIEIASAMRGATDEENRIRVAPGELKARLDDAPAEPRKRVQKSRAGRSAPRAAARRKVTAH